MMSEVSHVPHPTIVVGVNGSEMSKRALRWAVDYSTLSGAPIEAVIAWDLPPRYGSAASYDDVDLRRQAQSTLHDTVRDAVADDAPVTERVEKGHPEDVLVAASAHAGLIVIGAHSHSGVRGLLLGSVTHHCVQHARCPVVVIPAPST